MVLSSRASEVAAQKPKKSFSAVHLLISAAHCWDSHVVFDSPGLCEACEVDSLQSNPALLVKMWKSCWETAGRLQWGQSRSPHSAPGCRTDTLDPVTAGQCLHSCPREPCTLPLTHTADPSQSHNTSRAPTERLTGGQTLAGLFRIPGFYWEKGNQKNIRLPLRALAVTLNILGSHLSDMLCQCLKCNYKEAKRFWTGRRSFFLPDLIALQWKFKMRLIRRRSNRSRTAS